MCVCVCVCVCVYHIYWLCPPCEFTLATGLLSAVFSVLLAAITHFTLALFQHHKH